MLSSSKAFPPILAVALVVCIGVAHGIRCYKCGQYNEGVGSITPCINYTAHMLVECPSSDEWCILFQTKRDSQIRQRRIDGAGLRAPMCGERGLEHEDVLLPAGWLQFRPVVDSVEQHVFRSGDLAGDPRGVPKPSWLIRVVLQDDEPALRTSHASFTKLQSQKLVLRGGDGEGNVAPCISDVCAERSGLSTCDIAKTSIVVL